MIPDLLVLGVENRNKTVFLRWSPPQPPEFAGPEDLAKIISSFRGWVTQQKKKGTPLLLTGSSQGYISDPGVRKLLKLAYRASFEKDEGRPTQTNLYVWGAEDNLKDLFFQSFSEPLELDQPKLISRLSQTLHSSDAALLIREYGEKLVCDGIGLLNIRGSGHPLGGLYFDWIFDLPGFIVKIVEPGELQVREAGQSYTLRSTQLRVYSPFYKAKGVAEWLEEVKQKALDSLPIDSPDQRNDLLAVLPGWEATLVWSTILSAAAKLRHGGTLVVLPRPEEAPITLKYPTKPVSLRAQIGEYWNQVHCTIQAADEETFHQEIVKTFQFRERLISGARAVGHLTATDGCVVLDRDMTVRGFGGIIHNNEAFAHRKQLKYFESETENPLSKKDLFGRFGTRHQSAFRLCQAFPNSIAFVISQDGDLRIFSSDDKFVYFSDFVSP